MDAYNTSSKQWDRVLKGTLLQELTKLTTKLREFMFDYNIRYYSTIGCTLRFNSVEDNSFINLSEMSLPRSKYNRRFT